MIAGKVFLTRQIAPVAVKMLQREITDVEVWEEEMQPSRDVLLQKARSCVALLTTLMDRVDAELMDGAPNLRVVSNIAVGVDNFDITAATQRGVLLGYTPRVLSSTTADLAFALLLAVARRVVETERYVRDGSWKPWYPLQYLGYDVHHRVLGIVGLGQIGLEVARRGLGFDMEILYFDATRKPDAEKRHGLRYVPDLESLLRQADFVSLHVPLTPETHPLIGKPQLQMMKPTAFLINTSRGPVVDQRALYEALRDGVISGAALDVTDPEPIPLDDPLLTLLNVVITPHIGSASHETRTRMATMAAENIVAALKGEPMPACLNPGALHREGSA